MGASHLLLIANLQNLHAWSILDINSDTKRISWLLQRLVHSNWNPSLSPNNNLVTVAIVRIFSQFAALSIISLLHQLSYGFCETKPKFFTSVEIVFTSDRFQSKLISNWASNETFRVPETCQAFEMKNTLEILVNMRLNFYRKWGFEINFPDI